MSTRLVLITALLMCASWADAEIPRTMSYQGVLKNNGIVVPDGSYNVTFRLYADTTQAALWTETQTLVTTGGVFSAVLGRILPLSLPFDQPYYLGIAVGGSPEMTPRLPLTSAPYSLSGGGAAGWTVSGNNLHSSVTGNVGIGTSAPVAKLDVSGNIHGVQFKLLQCQS